MSWFWWVLVVLQCVGSLCTIAMIDRPRPPITRPQAIFSVCLNALLVIGIVYYAGMST